MIYKIGQALVIGAISLLFLAYANFAPTALQSNEVAGYVKNHFVREIIFGIALAIWTIKLTLAPKEKQSIQWIAIVGAIVIFPFWIAVLLGWSTQGLEKVWGDAIDSSAAYILHSTQVALFLLGLLLMTIAKKKTT